MKHDKNTILILIILVGIIWYSVSRIKWPIALDPGWSQPVSVTSSSDTIWDWLYLYKLQDTIMCLQPTGKGAARCFLLTNNSWVESDSMNFPKDYFLQDLAIDQENKIAMLSDGTITNEQIVMKVLLGTFTKNGFQNMSETKWEIDERSLFGDTGPSVYFGGTNKYEQGSLQMGTGIVDGSEIYVPYCAGAVTVTSHTEDGPFNTGVFHSSDLGKTWKMERVSDFEIWVPTSCKTQNYCYYFGQGYKFWSTRKSVGGNTWEPPLTLTKTFCHTAWRGSWRVSADGDKVHACWMDSRHNMWRFYIDTVPSENDDIVYRYRKDSDSSWSKDKILSKGLVYCFPPAMSVEGNKVVVVWAGSPTSDRDHSQGDPNDIFYVTSKDGGNTWTKPLKVTDKAKGGFDSGTPQVMLLNGVIHLFVIQGKPEKREPLSNWTPTGWPIYYTQRPFPN